MDQRITLDFYTTDNPENVSDNIESFKYTPLLPGEFRLLILRPGSQLDDLVINLATENFASTNQYAAISYCWGSSEKPKDLHCISQTSIRNRGSEGNFSAGRLPITTNLDRMLRTLRSEEDFLIAWIDAICINQDDVAEKAQQIQMMHRIYSKAAATILYAGEDDEETVPAFQCIKLLQELKELEDDSIMTFFQFRAKRFVSPRGQESGVSLVKAFSNLLSRDWFQRVWVMQEVVLSPRKRFHVGRLSILWEELVIACKVASKGQFTYVFSSLLNGLPGQSGSLMVTYYEQLAQLWNNLHFLESNSPLPEGITKEQVEKNAESSLAFTGILLGSRDLRATDSRDKIFAVSNIVFGYSCNEIPTIDYGISTEVVYTLVAKSWMQHHPGLQFLNCVQQTKASLDLPSWVPDWSTPWTSESFGIRGCFNASGSIPSEIQLPEIPTPFSLPIQLICKGVCLMRIETLAGKLQWFNDLIQLGLEDKLLDNYPMREETYCRSILALISNEITNTAATGTISTRTPFWRLVRPSEASVIHTTHSDKDAPVTMENHECTESFDGQHGQGPYIKQTERQTKTRPSGHPDLTALKSSMYTLSITQPSHFATNRQYMLSNMGFIGLVPSTARLEDEVALVFGAETPFVIRKEKNGCYKMIGECYVHGIMMGEAADGVPPDAVQSLTFV